MIHREPRWLIQVAAGVGLCTLVACGGGGGDVGPSPTPAAITVASGSAQTGEAGAQLPEPLVVRVTSSTGAPVEGTTVTFSVNEGSGSVASSSATTDANGSAETTWTLGTLAGNDRDTVTATVSGVSAAAIFTASVTAAAPATLDGVSGEGQVGIEGQALSQPLVVMARDQYGNPRDGVSVSWSVISGGGTLSPASSTTGSDGVATATWTAGSTGANQAQAEASGLAGSPVAFNASVTAAGQLVLTALSPNPMIEGQPATLSGAGFSTTPGDNKVKIDGVDATVTVASATSLTIQVPVSNCQPARNVGVELKVGNHSSNVLNGELNPAAFTTVAVGQELILQDPALFCLQFQATPSAEEYLVGVQSTSEVVTSLTPVKLTAVASAGTTISAQLPETRRGYGAGIQSERITRLMNLRLHRARAEAELRSQERTQVYPLLKQGFIAAERQNLSQRTAIPPTVKVGDVVPVRYPGVNDVCTQYVEVQAVVRVVGQHGVWLEDPDNPANGLTPDDIQGLSDQLDQKIYSTVTGYFGSPTDVDGNGRIAILLTQQVNKLRPGVVGHVTAADLFPRSVCASSDEGEIYYGVVPDPQGTAGVPVSREVVLRLAVQTIAHEFTHIIQFGRRHILRNDLPPQPIWIFEGQAVLAEEITGHVYEGRQPGKNYGFDVAFNADDPGSIDWYSYPFIGLLFYYGFESDATKVPHAPEECSYLAGKPENPGPCVGGLEVYGAPWTLLRWMSDQYGGNYPGGESGLHQALIVSPASGFASLAGVAGVPVRTLLAQWAASLYVDDRIAGASPSLQLSSWNLVDIENNVPESAHLVPYARGFISFSDDFNVRAGSSAYYRLNGTSRPATAVRIRNGSDGPLPGIMQVFIVRLK